MEEMLKKILEKLDNMDDKLENLEGQVSENIQILKALEHKTDIIKAEQENMNHDVAEISGNLKSLTEEHSTHLALTEKLAGKIMLQEVKIDRIKKGQSIKYVE